MFDSDAKKTGPGTGSAPAAPHRNHAHGDAKCSCGCGGPAVQRVSGVEKTGRNDPCPCGSGRKYKKCCGGGR